MYVTAAVIDPAPLTCFQLVPPANVVTGVDILPIVTPFPSFPVVMTTPPPIETPA